MAMRKRRKRNYFERKGSNVKFIPVIPLSPMLVCLPVGLKEFTVADFIYILFRHLFFNDLNFISQLKLHP